MTYCPRTGKIIHASRKEASMTMRGMQRKKPNRRRQTDRLNVFHCRVCGGWHVGNKEKVNERPERDQDTGL